jgi:hypothetical protein
MSAPSDPYHRHPLTGFCSAAAVVSLGGYPAHADRRRKPCAVFLLARHAAAERPRADRGPLTGTGGERTPTYAGIGLPGCKAAPPFQLAPWQVSASVGAMPAPRDARSEIRGLRVRV